MSLQHLLSGKQKSASFVLVGEPDKVIEGRHGAVACYRLTAEKGKLKQNNQGLSPQSLARKTGSQLLASSSQVSNQPECERWHFSPSYLPVGKTFSPDTDEEWIANAISHLPDVDFFITFTSFDQVRYWVGHRDAAVELALCFWADGESSWLRSELEKGRIDQFSYNYVLAEVKIYKNLWNLIKVSESDIKRILKKKWEFPFDSGRALFVEVVREVFEGEFCACLKRRYIYNASHTKKIATLKRKVKQEKASSIETKKLYSLIDQQVPFAVWLDRLLTVAVFLSEKNAVIKQYLENYREGIDDLTKLQIQRDCNPDLRHHRKPSHTWVQGQYHEGVLGWNA